MKDNLFANRRIKLIGSWLLVIPVIGSLLRGYLDPGGGSILFQIIVAGIMGFLVAARAFRGRIKSFFIKNSDTNEDVNSTDEPSEN